MQTGQISLELVIVIIVVAGAASSLAFLAQQTADSQQKLLVQNQAKEIAFSTAAGLKGLMQLQETAIGTTIEIPTRPMQILNPTFKEECKIEIIKNGINSEVRVEFDPDGSGQLPAEPTIKRETVIPDSFTVKTPVACGKNIQAQKT